MKGSFHAAAEREMQRQSFRTTVVPLLTKREVRPLLSFYPDQRDLTVLDIGANKGQWTRALLDTFGDRVARVHMFDPSPENYRELSNREDTLAGLGPEESERITAHQSAMGSTPGKATLYTNDDGSPLGSLYPHEVNGHGASLQSIRLDTKIEVPVDTVDEFISRNEIASVDIMKIDTEGHEMDVLRGAARSIHVGKIKLILFEFGFHQVESRHFFKDFWQFLTRRLYKMYFIDNDGKVHPIPRYEYRWERHDSIYEFIAFRSTWLWPAPLQLDPGADQVSKPEMRNPQSPVAKMGQRKPPAACVEPVPEAMGTPGEVLPPRELQDLVGGGGADVYKATGNEFLDYLIDLCGLQPGDAVLDVGCGSGRMALPLTGYLNRPKGRYAGFDVSREAIAWCTENISASHPNFDFTVVDVQNGTYNPKGKYKSSDFRFPYPDGSFDMVLLASVFTHMLPSDVKHYLHEIARVLKPGGRSLITFFLLNKESLALIKEGKASFNFEHEMPGYRMTDVENPEAAIAYPEDFVRYLYGECGLEFREPLRYGTWCGRTNGMSGQDVVIAVKPQREPSASMTAPRRAKTMSTSSARSVGRGQRVSS